MQHLYEVSNFFNRPYLKNQLIPNLEINLLTDVT